ncbi:MAG TPA: hypothetical protein VK327_01430 [Candidatus Paceibacterota bacterium]|nr:hypothetical protein [Candidatus Paceibacterota bacterium]
MEVYFKDLISEDASLEKLVDDLSRVVQGADDYARTIGVNVSSQAREEVEGQLHSLKQRCQHLKQQAMAGARATDKLLRAHPYTALGIIFGLGLFAGAVWLRKR